ncbi:MAG TPA: hypothetical protein LFW21_05870 [Rickettsia endosymbiont of Pyrocoelia pectoralis]|nr:hypothetical protein [Rickettsia endosymbiont of Pyrocoelia pectoralis]
MMLYQNQLLLLYTADILLVNEELVDEGQFQKEQGVCKPRSGAYYST